MGRKKLPKKKSKKQKPAVEQKDFCKYTYYEDTVQCVENDIEFINEQYEHFYDKAPVTLREDFGGTGKLACDWVAQNDECKAWAVDLDPEPIDYGKKNHFTKLDSEEQSRMKYVEGNVLDSHGIKAQVVVAFNFSYFIFKKRKQLVDYFKAIRKSLPKDGMFFMDLFGGPDSQQPLEEETEYDDYSYYWDCQKFNPITNECLFEIHFKPNGQKKIKGVFTYDWRMWTLAELRDCLEDAGFSKTIAYWEGDDDEDGPDDGEFYITEEAENWDSWVTYLAALP